MDFSFIYDLTVGDLLWIGLWITVAAPLIYHTYKITAKMFKAIAFVRQNNKKYRANMVKVEEMKAGGDNHEWISIPVMGQLRHVCKKTLYCPTINGFVSQEYLDKYIKAKEDGEKRKEFMEERIREICEKYGISYDILQQISEEVNTLPVEYAVQKVKEKIRGEDEKRTLQ